ncbi:MAG: multicopper oxidase domain-containing protein, partial [Persicimonas sp.]
MATLATFEDAANRGAASDAPGQWAFHCHLLYHMKA